MVLYTFNLVTAKIAYIIDIRTIPSNLFSNLLREIRVTHLGANDNLKIPKYTGVKTEHRKIPAEIIEGRLILDRSFSQVQTILQQCNQYQHHF